MFILPVHMKASNKGFSLIELMIAVVIVGIISAVAWPSYKSSVDTSRNAEAQNALLNLAILQTQYFTENRGYTEYFNKLIINYGGTDPIIMKTPNETHSIKIVADSTGTTYYMGTEPTSAGSTDGKQFYIDHLGRKYHGYNIVVVDGGFKAPNGNNGNTWTLGWD